MWNSWAGSHSRQKLLESLAYPSLRPWRFARRLTMACMAFAQGLMWSRCPEAAQRGQRTLRRRSAHSSDYLPQHAASVGEVRPGAPQRHPWLCGLASAHRHRLRRDAWRPLCAPTPATPALTHLGAMQYHAIRCEVLRLNPSGSIGVLGDEVPALRVQWLFCKISVRAPMHSFADQRPANTHSDLASPSFSLRPVSTVRQKGPISVVREFVKQARPEIAK